MDSRSHLATEALKLLYNCGEVEMPLNCYPNRKLVHVAARANVNQPIFYTKINRNVLYMYYISAIRHALTHFLNVDSRSHLATEALKLLKACGQLEIDLNYHDDYKSVHVDRINYSMWTTGASVKQPIILH